jgi:hypothetical protein
VRLSPLDYTLGGRVLGHYSLAAVSGSTTVLAAAALIFSMRYSDTNSLMVLKRISISAGITTAFTANQGLDVDAVAARGWTVSDTGGTAIVLAGNTNKARTNMGSSLMADARIASATALAAGATKTLDTNAFAVGIFPDAAATAGALLGGLGTIDLYNEQLAGQHPMVFAANEGFNLRLISVQGAAGVVKYYVRVDWAEVAGF